jgi:hypothetical protein
MICLPFHADGGEDADLAHALEHGHEQGVDDHDGGHAITIK